LKHCDSSVETCYHRKPCAHPFVTYSSRVLTSQSSSKAYMIAHYSYFPYLFLRVVTDTTPLYHSPPPLCPPHANPPHEDKKSIPLARCACRILLQALMHVNEQPTFQVGRGEHGCLIAFTLFTQCRKSVGDRVSDSQASMKLNKRALAQNRSKQFGISLQDN
jgi:hypothetical protein